MQKILIVISIISLANLSGYSQEEKLEIAGAIQIANSEDPTPDPGTIRWTGNDFEGFNGAKWVSLTGKQYVTDINNNRYPILAIGTQTWMLENLRAISCNDGTPIPLVTDNSAWEGLSTAGYSWYNNVASDLGALYNWYALKDCNVCPTGWHVPTDGEWTTLTDYLGGESVAGGKMKEAGLAHWITPNTDATNESEFTGLPGGFRNSVGAFFDRYYDGFWWSSSNEGWYRSLFFSNGNVSRDGYDKRFGLSVRCLKN